MTAVALDTLRISKRLREAGFSEPQAEAVTGVLHDAQEVTLGDLSTKADLLALRTDMDHGFAVTKAELKADIKDLRSELKLEISDVRQDIASLKGDVAILKWAVGIIVAGTIALVMKAFFIA